jgi:hypothetical protein
MNSSPTCDSPEDSVPSTAKDTLEAELKAWGGVDRFKAKK